MQSEQEKPAEEKLQQLQYPLAGWIKPVAVPGLCTGVALGYKHAAWWQEPTKARLLHDPTAGSANRARAAFNPHPSRDRAASCPARALSECPARATLPPCCSALLDAKWKFPPRAKC